MKATVLGIGNVLLRDEGVGVHVVERLQQRFALPAEVEVVDGGTTGMELTECLSRRDLVVIVDAVRTGRPAGTPVRLSHEELPAFFRTRISPHQLGLSEVLATLRLLNEAPRNSVLIGIEPVCMDTGLEMTPEVAAKVDELVDMVVAELKAAGFAVTAKAPAEVPCDAGQPSPWTQVSA